MEYVYASRAGSKGFVLFDEIEDVNEDLESSGIHKDLSEFPIYEKANR